MKLTKWMCAAATAILGASSTPAYAADAPRSVFCMATRTTPRLDQNNYVSGAMGQVFITRTFATDLPDERLIPMWRTFIIAKHPASTQAGIPGDSCFPENARRTKVSTFGDVRTLTVNWTPEPAKPAGK